jgi:hypothetical protein
VASTTSLAITNSQLIMLSSAPRIIPRFNGNPTVTLMDTEPAAVSREAFIRNITDSVAVMEPRRLSQTLKPWQTTRRKLFATSTRPVLDSPNDRICTTSNDNESSRTVFDALIVKSADEYSNETSSDEMKEPEAERESHELVSVDSPQEKSDVPGDEFPDWSTNTVSLNIMSPSVGSNIEDEVKELDVEQENRELDPPVSSRESIVQGDELPDWPASVTSSSDPWLVAEVLLVSLYESCLVSTSNENAVPGNSSHTDSSSSTASTHDTISTTSTNSTRVTRNATSLPVVSSSAASLLSSPLPSNAVVDSPSVVDTNNQARLLVALQDVLPCLPSAMVPVTVAVLTQVWSSQVATTVPGTINCHALTLYGRLAAMLGDLWLAFPDQRDAFPAILPARLGSVCVQYAQYATASTNNQDQTSWQQVLNALATMTDSDTPGDIDLLMQMEELLHQLLQHVEWSTPVLHIICSILPTALQRVTSVTPSKSRPNHDLVQSVMKILRSRRHDVVAHNHCCQILAAIYAKVPAALRRRRPVQFLYDSSVPWNVSLHPRHSVGAILHFLQLEPEAAHGWQALTCFFQGQSPPYTPAVLAQAENVWSVVVVNTPPAAMSLVAVLVPLVPHSCILRHLDMLLYQALGHAAHGVVDSCAVLTALAQYCPESRAAMSPRIVKAVPQWLASASSGNKTESTASAAIVSLLSTLLPEITDHVQDDDARQLVPLLLGVAEQPPDNYQELRQESTWTWCLCLLQVLLVSHPVVAQSNPFWVHRQVDLLGQALAASDIVELAASALLTLLPTITPDHLWQMQAQLADRVLTAVRRRSHDANACMPLLELVSLLCHRDSCFQVRLAPCVPMVSLALVGNEPTRSRTAFATLRRLSCASEEAVNLCTESVVDRLVQGLTQKSLEADIVVHGLMILLVLVKQSAIREYLSSHHFPRVLVWLMQNNCHDADVVGVGLALLNNVAVSMTSKSMAPLNGHILDTVIGVMHRHAEEATVQKNGVLLLKSCTYQETNLRLLQQRAPSIVALLASATAKFMDSCGSRALVILRKLD